VNTRFWLATILFAPVPLSAQDRAWWDTVPAPAAPMPEFTRQSVLVPMRDGVRLAVDVYLPTVAEKVPTIVEQTRYRRAMQFRDDRLNNGAGPGSGLMAFLRDGYAVVMADVRGTGASFGTRAVEFSPAEVLDGWDLLEWITEQPWSNDTVGATGVSYPGTTAELMGTLGHPALLAIAPRFSLYDFYPDVILPGGIFLERFFRNWGGMVTQMDNGRFDEPGSPVVGVRPVDGPDGAALLVAATAEHAANGNIWEQTRTLVARDDSSGGFRIEDVSSHTRYDTLSRRIPIYNYSGWADGGFGLAAIKRFLAQPSPGSRLIMGPWNHGGQWAWYPGVGAVRSEFGHLTELRRFFDHHLRGRATGIERDAPVNYFTTGINKWRAAEKWPIPTVLSTWSLQHAGELAPIVGKEDRATAVVGMMTLDSALGTGGQSRWNTILGGGAVNYPPRATPARPNVRTPTGALPGELFFTSEPLKSDLTVTGHPVFTLAASVTGGEANVFVYLEEVDSTGMGWLVTEGQLNLLHRKVAPAPGWYPVPEAHHSYLRRDMQPIEAGEPIVAPIALLPVSHQFKRGSRIRVVITGADHDHFRLTKPFVLNVTGSSTLQLPIEP
jgi:putative CocE/NonD family hydrolase